MALTSEHLVFQHCLLCLIVALLVNRSLCGDKWLWCQT